LRRKKNQEKKDGQVNWDKLCSVLSSQEEIIRNNILNEKGSKKKEKAENALNSLFLKCAPCSNEQYLNISSWH